VEEEDDNDGDNDHEKKKKKSDHCQPGFSIAACNNWHSEFRNSFVTTISSL
jgi:hypothetical protein